ncbi:hypothetical protein FWG95_02050 [Candidatus Saccharibacteria bacterium]|nr:hypothetical protein [Candidatus Saccharibacteria bacterium]
MAKSKSTKATKSKAAHKGVNWNLILFTVIGTILALVIVGTVIATPSVMRYKFRKEAFKQLNLGDKGFTRYELCKIDGRRDNNSTACSFVYGATVRETVDKIKSVAKDAGWEFIGSRPEGEPDNANMLHFKNDRGNFLIVNLNSKSHFDAFINAIIMGQPQEEATNLVDANAGPTMVYVEINKSHDW